MKRPAADLRERLEATIAGNAPMPSVLSFRFDLNGHQALAKLVAGAIERHRQGQKLAAPSEILAPLP